MGEMLGKGGALIVVCIVLSLPHASGFISGFSSAASLAPLRNSQNARYGGRAASSQPPLRLAAAAAHRQRSTVQARMQATSGIIISEVDDYTEIRSIASFFVEAFWAQGTATGPVELSPSQRPLLEAEQERDMAERYGKLVGKRKLMASLLVARLDTGEVAGCVGVEVAVADRFSGEVLPRSRGEDMLGGALAAMGARERNRVRQMSLGELATAVLPESMGLVPVLSNLAVGVPGRGRGLGKQLVGEAERVVKEWGFAEMLLLVEKTNTPAIGLYNSLGYAEVWSKPTQAARVTPEGSNNILQYEMVETCALGKQLI